MFFKYKRKINEYSFYNPSRFRNSWVHKVMLYILNLQNVHKCYMVEIRNALAHTYKMLNIYEIQQVKKQRHRDMAGIWAQQSHNMITTQ